ncbi:type II toxin-antitoxin system death-on-curing family toxin [Nocardia wallacei]|uniref:type II toxin-antitoxin system death-on-curing family toxin n=1 Tax=Nocardia wallacei TaxID=480035 RepID=UPI0024585FCC|nr:Fic family protein [Nocardia wallacei]
MVEYLTADDLIRFNAAQDGGVGVADLEGVKSNALRPTAAFGGVEKFPDIWTKAAAYVHGIATTQYFTDGNKRTAWLAAVTFLGVNGIDLPRVADIEAEALVQAIAQDVWKTDEDPELTLTKAAEWFRTKSEASRTDVLASWELPASSVSMVITGAFFAEYCRAANNKMDVLGGVLDRHYVPSMPIRVPLTIVMICQTGVADVGRTRSIDGYVVRPGGEPQKFFRLMAAINEAENRFFFANVELDVYEPGRHVFQLVVEGNESSARTVSLEFLLI